MLETDIIEECKSSWTSPVLMVPRKTGGVRVCVDYRKINANLLPRIDDLLHFAKSTVYITTLDLQRDYYQIKVVEVDRPKTCFITPFGTFQFKRMPFGLRNAPATFQRLIDRFKSTIPNVQILAYLDDIIVCSSSFKNHLQDLDLVFDRLQRFKLHVNSAKCRFCCKNVKFLGHILTENGISIDSE